MRRWFDALRLSGLECDRRWALFLHRGADWPPLLRLLSVCSHLGEWPLWAALLVLLPLVDGARGGRCAQLMLGLGTLNLLLYLSLKRGTRRPRPFEACQGIRACVRASDRFSFPSGHTLHAVAFAILLSASYPLWSWPLWTFALLVATSRVILGLHYPSDVAVGALLGAGTGLAWVAV